VRRKVRLLQARELAQELFYRGIDFNFIDYPSVRRAQVRDGRLTVSGLDFRFFYNMKGEKRQVPVALRVVGEPGIWNAFTGEARPLYRFQHESRFAMGGRLRWDHDVEVPLFRTFRFLPFGAVAADPER
jgi:hypothetical protein